MTITGRFAFPHKSLPVLFIVKTILSMGKNDIFQIYFLEVIRLNLTKIIEELLSYVNKMPRGY
jgi:hypothetical protein